MSFQTHRVTSWHLLRLFGTFVTTGGHTEGVIMSDRYVALSDEAAQRLSDAILRRRVELGIRSARSLGEETGLDYRTITGLEGARRDQVSRTTLAVLEMHLQWPAGYLSALLKQEGWRKSVELQVPSNADERDVEQARRIAQASFDAALRSMG